MERTPLFRPAAVEAQRASVYGGIVLVRPLSLAVLTAFVCFAAAAVVILLVWGRYTSHSTVRGSLVPTGGVIELTAPQAGTVVDKMVEEGAHVAAGATLFAVSGERVSSEHGATLETVRMQLLAQRQSIEAQMERIRDLEIGARRFAAARISALEDERVALRASMKDQRARLAFAAEAAERYRSVEAQGFVSREQAAARHEAVLEQRSRLNALERDSARIERELVDAQGAVETLAASYASEIAELERAAASVARQLAESEAARRVLVLAPQSGIATAVTAEAGQTVTAGQTLALIVPTDAPLQAHLYAPSSAVGFLDAGKSVWLRYDAYPYAKFGHQHGMILSVSRTAVPTAGGVPLYQIVVALDEQTIDVNGERRTLRAGMAVEADIVQETRRLYEWMLDPLLALRGRAR